MATTQIQKMRSAGIVTKTAIKQEQSLEIVQTMLHGSLSLLSYLRNFFPEHAFDKLTYESSNDVHAYEDYAAGNILKGKEKKTSDRETTVTVMQVLRRHRSKRVDELLNWLENGAFVALKSRNLRSLRVYVHADRKHRENVIETYTFNINYSTHGNGATLELAGVEVDGHGDHGAPIRATDASVHYVFRQILQLCNGLPELPEKRFISMALFYVNDEDYPNGFVPNTTNSLLFAEAKGWKRCSETMGELQSGFHTVTLQISHLQENDSHIKRSYTFSEPPTIPQILKYTSSTKLGEELDQAQDVTALDATTVALVDSETPSTVVQDHGETLLATQDLESEEFPAVFTSNMDAQATTETEMQPESEPASSAELTHRKQTGSSRVDESLDTESSNVPIVKRTIREMMQLEHMTQGDTQTQHFFHPPHPEGTAPRRTSTRLRASTSAPKTTLSQAMVKILDESEATLRKTASRLTKSEGRNKQNSNLVLCQCGSAEEEGDMVKCVYCNTWQHLHCYGYTGEDDTRIPADDYVCYQCLLGGREEGRLEMLAQIAVKRRAMYLAEQQGLTTQRDFAAKLGLDTAVAKPVYHYLKNEGYIVSVGGAHKKAKFVAVKDGPKHEKMLKDLFDPFMHISHHYDLPAKYDTQKKSLGRQLLSSQASIMPPPKTPASGLRRDPTTSPSTGLDFRASMPTLETPSRAPSLRHQSSKRSRDEDAAIETSAKRHAGPSLRQRGQSSQSEFLLDASGLASSPAAPQTPAGTFTAL